MIVIRNLTYRDLRIPSLSIPEGKTTLIGPNGSGKTTFLRLIAGIVLPEQGTIEIDGRAPRECAAGWVDEYPDRSILFPTVADEIASSLEFRYIPCSETETRVQEIAGRLGITPLLHRFTKDISGGERTLVSLAAALIANPDPLVLDEFDSHLDRDTLTRANRILEGSTARHILRCTQGMDIAVSSSCILFFTDGRIVLSGSPDHVFPYLQDTAFYPIAWSGMRNEAGI